MVSVDLKSSGLKLSKTSFKDSTLCFLKYLPVVPGCKKSKTPHCPVGQSHTIATFICYNFSMKIMKHKKYLVGAVVVLSAFFWVVAWGDNDRQETDNAEIKPVNTIVNESEVIDTPVQAGDFDELSQIIEPEIPPLQFVTIDNWVSISPPDGSYTLMLPKYFTYGFCEDDSGAVLVGMIFLNDTGVYDCGVTGRDALDATNPLLTRVALYAVSEKPIIPSDASSTDAKLQDGSSLNRYSFQTTDSGVSINHIVYILEKQDLFYVAYNRWESDDIQKYPSLEEFDTIVVKTWLVN